MSSLQIPQSRGRLALASLSYAVVDAVAETTEVVVEVAVVGSGVAAGLGRMVVAAVGVTSGSVGSGQVVSALVRTKLTDLIKKIPLSGERKP